MGVSPRLETRDGNRAQSLYNADYYISLVPYVT
jgi:hypothetical protein